jgi:hypothetical protein
MLKAFWPEQKPTRTSHHLAQNAMNQLKRSLIGAALTVSVRKVTSRFPCVYNLLLFTASVIFVCCKCNDRVNREKPWLSERSSTGQLLSGDHDWSHRLVFAPNEWEDDTLPVPNSTLKLEERVASLEAKIDSQAAIMAQHLGTIERLMRKMSNDKRPKKKGKVSGRI